MSQEVEEMTEQEMRHNEWGMKAGMFLTGAATCAGVVWLVSVLFGN